MKRRLFLRGAAATIAAPALVARANIMAVRPVSQAWGISIVDLILREAERWPDLRDRVMIMPPSWGFDLAKPGGDHSAIAVRHGELVRVDAFTMLVQAHRILERQDRPQPFKPARTQWGGLHGRREQWR